jgi:hypothetical protein
MSFWSQEILRVKKLYHIFFSLYHAQSSNGQNLATLQVQVFQHFTHINDPYSYRKSLNVDFHTHMGDNFDLPAYFSKSWINEI